MTSTCCTQCGEVGHALIDCPYRDKVNHPFHYTQGKIETIDLIEEIVQHYPDPVIGGSIWQVIKYISRAPHKGNLGQDLEKARWYLDRAIGHAQKEGST